MSRWEFMSQLEKLLLYVPIQEREEALQYYNDYFEDAGPEREQEVIASLGSPEQVAENIKRDVYQSSHGVEPDRVEPGKEMVEYSKGREIYEEPMYKDSSLPIWVKILIAACIVPPLFGIVGTVIGVLAGVLGGVFGVLLAGVITTGVIGLVCPLVGILTVFCGAFVSRGNIFAGLAVIGVGLLCTALGMLGIWLEVMLVGKGIPAIIKGIGKGAHKVVKKLRGGKKHEKVY